VLQQAAVLYRAAAVPSGTARPITVSRGSSLPPASTRRPSVMRALVKILESDDAETDEAQAGWAI